MNGKELVSNIFMYAMLTILGMGLAYVAVNVDGDVQTGTIIGLIFYVIIVALGALRGD